MERPRVKMDVVTPAGLVVSQDAAQALKPKPTAHPAVVARDHDGRRRVVLSRQDARRLLESLTLMNRQGFNFALVCTTRPDAEPACGETLHLESGPDKGLGCACTRIHFL